MLNKIFKIIIMINAFYLLLCALGISQLFTLIPQLNFLQKFFITVLLLTYHIIGLGFFGIVIILGLLISLVFRI